jgi:hypothetical protein
MFQILVFTSEYSCCTSQTDGDNTLLSSDTYETYSKLETELKKKGFSKEQIKTGFSKGLRKKGNCLCYTLYIYGEIGKLNNIEFNRINN